MLRELKDFPLLSSFLRLAMTLVGPLLVVICTGLVGAVAYSHLTIIIPLTFPEPSMLKVIEEQKNHS